MAAIVCPLMISGCGFQPVTSENTYHSTRVTYDPYQKDTWIIGPEYHFELAQYANLRAYAEGNNILFYQLYVRTYEPPNSSWAFYDRAYSINGKRLNFVSIDRKVESGGGTREIFGISFSRKELNDAKESGINIKAIGKYNEVVISIPSAYIIGFLEKVDEFRNQR
jgi:hypothetical protein